MSTSQVAQVKVLYDLIARGDMAAAGALVTGDRFLMHEAEGTPYGGVYVGPAGLLELSAKMQATWKYIEVNDLVIVDGDNWIMVRLNLTVTSRQTGRTATFPMVEVYRMEGDLIQSIEAFYWDTHALRETVGADD